MKNITATPCGIKPGPGKVCFEPAHVVLFADRAGEFAGVVYERGSRILACLSHGGQIYDALKGAAIQPAWLAVYGWYELPQPRMPYHRSETPREARPRSPRPWPSRR